MGFSLKQMFEDLELALSEPETQSAQLAEIRKTLRWWKEYAQQCGELPQPETGKVTGSEQ